MKIINRKRSTGFVGVVFLAIALIGIVVAAIASMSRESTSGTSREKMKMDVAVILKQGSDFKLAIDKFVADGGDPYSETSEINGVIVFDDYPDMNKEFALRPPLSAASTESPSYRLMHFYDGEVGGDEPFYQFAVLVLPLASKEYCQIVNNMTLGKKINDEPGNLEYSDTVDEGCSIMPGTGYAYIKPVFTGGQPFSEEE